MVGITKEDKSPTVDTNGMMNHRKMRIVAILSLILFLGMAGFYSMPSSTDMEYSPSLQTKEDQTTTISNVDPSKEDTMIEEASNGTSIDGHSDSSSANTTSTTTTAVKDEKKKEKKAKPVVTNQKSKDVKKQTPSVGKPTGSMTEHYFRTKEKQVKVQNVKEELNDDGFCVGPISLPAESDVNSIFNCESASGLCHYYYPAKFFSSCGVGQDYEYLVYDTEDKRLNFTLWNKMPSIGFPTLSLPEKSLSMIHVHKSGGTSLHTAFNKASRGQSAKLVRHHWFFPSYEVGVSNYKPTYERNFHFARTAAQAAVRYPESFGPTDHVFFAIIRDPAERFLSSIGQAMGARGSSANGIAESFQNECIKETTKETLRCCIDYVKRHTFWVEIHFTPQSLEVSFATLWQDVPVAIFDFKDLPTVLENLGLNPATKMRDGGQTGYRKSEILGQLSTDDYDDDMLRDVCEIYKVDLLMRRLAGITNNLCDKVITY